jgi:hypothetical protein
MLFLPSGEKMERLIVSQIALQMEKTIDVLFARRDLRQLMATGQDADCMPPSFQTFGYFVAPLGVTTRAGWGKEVREKKDSHVTCRAALSALPLLSAARAAQERDVISG